MDRQTAGKCIATSSPAKHDLSQARLYRINDYDVEQNYEKSYLAYRTGQSADLTVKGNLVFTPSRDLVFTPSRDQRN